MIQNIILPKQGLQMTEGFITRWLHKEGDRIQAGEPLFEMETDKLVITIDAAYSGTLLKILYPEGSTVPITTVIAYVGEEGDPVPEAPGSGCSGKRGARRRTQQSLARNSRRRPQNGRNASSLRRVRKRPPLSTASICAVLCPRVRRG